MDINLDMETDVPTHMNSRLLIVWDGREGVGQGPPYPGLGDSRSLKNLKFETNSQVQCESVFFKI
jgi:hypothetical protein